MRALMIKFGFAFVLGMYASSAFCGVMLAQKQSSAVSSSDKAAQNPDTEHGTQAQHPASSIKSVSNHAPQVKVNGSARGPEKKTESTARSEEKKLSDLAKPDASPANDVPPEKSVYTIKNGQNTLRVSLKANPSTGYLWYITSYDTHYLQLLDQKYMLPNSKLMGAPGHEVWTFQVLPQASTGRHFLALNFLYARPSTLPQGSQKTVYIASQ